MPAVIPVSIRIRVVWAKLKEFEAQGYINAATPMAVYHILNYDNTGAYIEKNGYVNISMNQIEQTIIDMYMEKK